MNHDNAVTVILACCVLHNYMRTESVRHYNPPGFADTLGCDGEVLDGTWRLDGANENHNQEQNINYTLTGAAVRDRFVEHLNGVGAVPWQQAHVNRTG
jgi:hypothetical protein